MVTIKVLVAYEQHDVDGISIMLKADDTFKVSGSLIQFTPTRLVQ